MGVVGGARRAVKPTRPVRRTKYHLGDEVVCLLEGSITFTLEGKPDVTLKAGETCHISAKQSHFGTTASESVKFLSIQVQETGAPSGRLRAE
jgi:quercetin dioxygenase-like cupin family protein